MQDLKDMKMKMATTEAEMDLTNPYKESLLEGGIPDLVLRMVSHSDIQVKTMAVKSV